MKYSIVQEAWSAVAADMGQSERVSTAWVAALLEVGSPRSVAKDKLIISIDHKDTNRGFLLVDGEYIVTKTDAPEIVKEAPELLGELGRMNPTLKRTASVRASSEITLILFQWDEIYGALRRRLSDSDFEEMKKSLEDYGWGHFTE